MTSISNVHSHDGAPAQSAAPTAAAVPASVPPAAPASPASPVTVHDDRTATVRDARGRSIKIKKLSAHDRYRLFRALGAEQSENRRMVQYASLAASVTELAGDPVSFPISSVQVDAIIARLDDEGLDAVMVGLAELLPADEDTSAKLKN